MLTRVLVALCEATWLLAPCVVSKVCILLSQFTGIYMKHAASNSQQLWQRVTVQLSSKVNHTPRCSVLQVFLGSYTLEFSGTQVKTLVVGFSKVQFIATYKQHKTQSCGPSTMRCEVSTTYLKTLTSYLVQLLTYINVATLNIRILVARVKVIGVVIGIFKAFKAVCDI